MEGYDGVYGGIWWCVDGMVMLMVCDSISQVFAHRSAHGTESSVAGFTSSIQLHHSGNSCMFV